MQRYKLQSVLIKVQFTFFENKPAGMVEEEVSEVVAVCGG